MINKLKDLKPSQLKDLAERIAEEQKTRREDAAFGREKSLKEYNEPDKTIYKINHIYVKSFGFIHASFFRVNKITQKSQYKITIEFENIETKEIITQTTQTRGFQKGCLEYWYTSSVENIEKEIEKRRLALKEAEAQFDFIKKENAKAVNNEN